MWCAPLSKGEGIGSLFELVVWLNGCYNHAWFFLHMIVIDENYTILQNGKKES